MFRLVRVPHSPSVSPSLSKPHVFRKALWMTVPSRNESLMAGVSPGSPMIPGDGLLPAGDELVQALDGLPSSSRTLRLRRRTCMSTTVRSAQFHRNKCIYGVHNFYLDRNTAQYRLRIPETILMMERVDAGHSGASLVPELQRWQMSWFLGIFCALIGQELKGPREKIFFAPSQNP